MIMSNSEGSGSLPVQRSTPKPGLHPKKTLLCVWWGIRGIVHFELLKYGQTVNADLYCEQLNQVNRALIAKCLK